MTVPHEPHRAGPGSVDEGLLGRKFGWGLVGSGPGSASPSTGFSITRPPFWRMSHSDALSDRNQMEVWPTEQNRKDLPLLSTLSEWRSWQNRSGHATSASLLPP